MDKLDVLKDKVVSMKRENECNEEKLLSSNQINTLKSETIYNLNSDLNLSSERNLYSNSGIISYPKADIISFLKTEESLFTSSKILDELEKDGWIIIQRRVDDSVDFKKYWHEYKTGFGSKDGNYWMGLEDMYELTKNDKWKLKLVVVVFENKKRRKREVGGSLGDGGVVGSRVIGSGVVGGGDKGDEVLKKKMLKRVEEFFGINLEAIQCDDLTVTTAAATTPTATTTTESTTNIPPPPPSPSSPTIQILHEEYTSFYLSPEHHKYRLHLTGPLNPSYATFGEHNGAEFSTYDRPNPLAFQMDDNGWWYNDKNRICGNSAFKNLFYYVKGKNVFMNVKEIVLGVKKV